jgi:hypothetical protein
MEDRSKTTTVIYWADLDLLKQYQREVSAQRHKQVTLPDLLHEIIREKRQDHGTVQQKQQRDT